MHKLLYFAQREAILQNGCPLFSEEFSAWKYGPVLPCIRESYRDNDFPKASSLGQQETAILNIVFNNYAYKSSWSLSRLTHGEFSWQNARKGIPEDENSSSMISISDIKVDANRIKERRRLFRYANNQ